MKNNTPKWLAIALFALSLFNVATFYSVHSIWSGIVVVLGHMSPYIIMLLIFAIAVTSSIMFLENKRSKVLSIICFCFSVLFFVLECYMVYQGRGSLRYILREFGIAALSMLGIAIVVFFVFYYKNTKLAELRWFKYVVTFAFIFVFAIAYFGLGVNRFTSKPVVYAVEDEYQIVFTTSVKGTAWVEIDGQKYGDTYAGYLKSEDKVHKITVPQEVLDKAKGYEIHSQAMLLRGPYTSLLGRDISSQNAWRGVKESDGLQYFEISDTHEYTYAGSKTASAYGDKLDFLILNGDISSFLDRQSDIGVILEIANNVTKGEVPVIYSRGNHETKGLLADELYKYVGSKNQDFFYTVRLGSTWAIVLDMGEDHEDEWWEFANLARFDEYRQRQTEFLQSVLDNADEEFDAEGVNYRIAISHIPLNFTYKNDYAKEFKADWVEKLNQMKITIALHGHRHQVMYLDTELGSGTELKYVSEYAGYDAKSVDGYLGDANFQSIICSRRSDVMQISTSENVYGRKIIGAMVEMKNGETTIKLMNTQGEQIQNIVSPWKKGLTYGSQIVIKNK